MPNDDHWNRHTTEWVDMQHKSRRRKESEGKSLQRTETNLTEREHQQDARSAKAAPHSGAKPPHS